jgi:hypothetical protein
MERWFNPNWLDLNSVPTTPVDLPVLRQTFIDAVVKRLMSDVPLAILLSGGLDSSLVASVAVRCARGRRCCGRVPQTQQLERATARHEAPAHQPALPTCRACAGTLRNPRTRLTQTISCTLSRSASRGLRTSSPRARCGVRPACPGSPCRRPARPTPAALPLRRWLTSWARSTTRWSSPSRRALTRCATWSGTLNRTSRCAGAAAVALASCTRRRRSICSSPPAQAAPVPQRRRPRGSAALIREP